MSKWICAAIMGLAISTFVSLAFADKMTDNECARIKKWVSSVPEGEQQVDVLLSDVYFKNHFGKTFDTLTMKEINRLHYVTGYPCEVWAEMTKVQLNTAHELLSPQTQARLANSPRPQPTEPVVVVPPSDKPMTPAPDVGAGTGPKEGSTPPPVADGAKSPKEAAPPTAQAGAEKNKSEETVPPKKGKWWEKPMEVFKKAAKDVVRETVK